MERLLLENAGYAQVLEASGGDFESLCRIASSLTSKLSKDYMQRLGKEIIRVASETDSVPEEAYELISNAMLHTSESDASFCWVEYSSTRIRILNPYSPMLADMDGDFLGLRLWEAEICSLEWMESNIDCVKGQDVLEIGCGVSLAGFAAMERMGARTLTLCDYNPRVMENLHIMLEAKPDFTSAIHLLPLDWNQSDQALPIAPTLIIAADCVYDPNDIPNFVRTLNAMMKQTQRAQCLLACSVRNPKTYAALHEELAKYASELVATKLTPGAARYCANSTHMMTKNWKREEVELYMLMRK